MEDTSGTIVNVAVSSGHISLHEPITMRRNAIKLASASLKKITCSSFINKQQNKNARASVRNIRT